MARTWDKMSEAEQDKLLSDVVKLISEWKQIPEAKLRQLPPQALKRIQEMVEKLRAQGMAGPHHKAPDRLKVMQAQINQWAGEQQGEPSPDEVVQAMPEPARSQQRAQESMALKQTYAQANLDQRRTLANLRRGTSAL